MTIRAVLFDLDGVLVDTGEVHYEALNRALTSCNCGIVYPEHHRELYNGLPTTRKLEMLVDRGTVHPDQVSTIAQLKRRYTTDLLRDRVKFDPEIYCLLAGLQCRRLARGVVSNAVRETVKSVCDSLGITELVNVLLSNEDGPPKPAPDLYRLACSKLGLPPSECLAVEDGKYGVESARAAGCRVLRVKNRSEVTATNVWGAMC